MAMEDIRMLNIEKDDQGCITKIWFAFGPHYFVEVRQRGQGKVEFVLGATHHGFRVDASEVSGELEKLIEDIRGRYPDKTVD